MWRKGCQYERKAYAKNAGHLLDKLFAALSVVSSHTGYGRVQATLQVPFEEIFGTRTQLLL